MPYAEHLDLAALYPLVDACPRGLTRHTARAKPTGEFRPPKTGEWYLSGARIEAYQARVDLQQPFHIARIVAAKKIVTWVELT